jgi:hypothetical protein
MTSNLNLPTEIVDIINKFVDYDINSIKYAKHLATKNPNLEKIKNAISRNNPRDYFDEDDNGHWIYGFENDSNEHLQLQCIHCIKCGNYKELAEDKHVYYIIRRKVPIMCLCKDNEYLAGYKQYEDYDPNYE